MSEPSTVLSTTQTQIENNEVINQAYFDNYKYGWLNNLDIQNLGLSTNVDMEETNKLDVISINDLLNEKTIILQKEEADVNRLNAFFAPTMDSLRAALLIWASKGFPPVEKLATLNLDPAPICSDGQIRTLPYYIEYILKDSITNKLNGLNAKTQGMSFTFSWVDTSISLYVTRT